MPQNPTHQIPRARRCTRQGSPLLIPWESHHGRKTGGFKMGFHQLKLIGGFNSPEKYAWSLGIIITFLWWKIKLIWNQQQTYKAWPMNNREIWHQRGKTRKCRKPPMLAPTEMADLRWHSIIPGDLGGHRGLGTGGKGAPRQITEGGNAHMLHLGHFVYYCLFYPWIEAQRSSAGISDSQGSVA